MLRCADGTIYSGYLTDPILVAAHNSGQGTRYIRSRLPVGLVSTEGVSQKSEALKYKEAPKNSGTPKRLL